MTFQLNIILIMCVCPSVCLSVWRLSVCLFVFLSVCLFVCLSVCLSVCLFVCMLFCLPKRSEGQLDWFSINVTARLALIRANFLIGTAIANIPINNGYRMYVDIMTGENLSSIWFLIWIINQLVYQVGGELWGKRGWRVKPLF